MLIRERNELVYEARQAKTSVKEALKNYKRMVLLINSASEFMEAVYSETFDVSEVLETVFEKGMDHRLHFFMALSPESMKNWPVTGRFVSLETGSRESTLGELLMSRVFLIMRSHLLRGAGLIRLEPHLRGRKEEQSSL